ncbi:hypothetical protein H0911_28065, partial [Bacillus sp. HSTU-bmb18]
DDQDNKVINEKPVIKVDTDEIFVEKGKKDLDVKKEINVKVTDKEDGDLTDKAVVEGTVDTNKVGEQKVKVKVTDKDAGTSEKEITVNIIDVKDNIEINKEDIVDGKVKEDKIDKTKVIEGLKEEDKDRVKVEITVNEENGKGKVTVKDKDGNT